MAAGITWLLLLQPHLTFEEKKSSASSPEPWAPLKVDLDGPQSTNERLHGEDELQALRPSYGDSGFAMM